MEILHGLETVGIPVLCVPLDTYTATSRLQGPQGLPPGGLLTPSSTVKLQAISDLFLQSTCNEFIGTVLQGKTARTEMTSYIFQVRGRRPNSEVPSEAGGPGSCPAFQCGAQRIRAGTPLLDERRRRCGV